MEKTERKWTSLDIYLAAYLAYRGIPVELDVLAGDRVIFTAIQCDELSRLVSAFSMNDPVPAADYVATLRMLKARMYAARDTARGTR